MANLINIFVELTTKGSTILPSTEVKGFNKVAQAHGLKYEIGPHNCGKSVLITI